MLVSQLPEIATLSRSPQGREGKVYIDFLQNGHGRLLVSPYSVRPLPGAPVSTPLRWREVNKTLDIHEFTIQTLPRRLKRMKSDPLLDIFNAKPDLLTVLEKLGRYVQKL